MGYDRTCRQRQDPSRVKHPILKFCLVTISTPDGVVRIASPPPHSHYGIPGQPDRVRRRSCQVRQATRRRRRLSESRCSPEKAAPSTQPRARQGNGPVRSANVATSRVETHQNNPETPFVDNAYSDGRDAMMCSCECDPIAATRSCVHDRRPLGDWLQASALMQVNVVYHKRRLR